MPRHIDFANARALLLRGHVLQESKTERGSDFVIPGGGPVTAVVARKAAQVQRCNLNRKIAPLGLHIRSAGSGFRDGVYEIEFREPREMPAANGSRPSAAVR